MSQSILLRGARQLLTLRGKPSVRRGSDLKNLELIEDGSVFIQNGKIAAVGPTRRLENLKEARGAINVPVHNCVVMPGFIDASIRMSLLAPQESGKGARRRKLNDFYEHALRLMRACLAHGTLHVGIQAASGVQSVAADLSVLRQLRRIGNNPVGITRIWSPNSTPPNSAALQAIAKQGLASSMAFKCLAQQAQWQSVANPCLSAHVDWCNGEIDELASLLASGEPASVFCRHHLADQAIRLIAESNSAAVFPVGGSTLDREPVSSVRTLADQGGAIVLGSGYHALSEPNFNMQIVLALAVMRLNLTIEQAIVATTINAAYAINQGNEIGSLEPGKHADVLILNLNDYRELPRRLGVNHVAMIIRDGVITANRMSWKVGAA